MAQHAQAQAIPPTGAGQVVAPGGIRVKLAAPKAVDLEVAAPAIIRA